MNLEKIGQWFSIFLKGVRIVISVALVVGAIAALYTASTNPMQNNITKEPFFYLSVGLLTLVIREWTTEFIRGLCTLVVFACLGYGFTITASTSMDDYAVKAQFSEGYSLARKALDATVKYHQEHNKFPDTNQAAALPAPDQMKGVYVTQITVKTGGVIQVIYGNKINQPFKGRSIEFRPTVADADRQIIWDCSGGTLPEKYRSNTAEEAMCR